MTDLEYNEMIEEAHSIPIIEVAALVMDGFTKIGAKYTGKCPNHTDNKIGNFSFNIAKNYARCFSCNTSFTTINLVKACLNVGFKDAINFLYTNFPSYFSQKPDYINSGECAKWKGLSSDEYRFLKFTNKFLVNGKYTSIRVFATLFPEEHDQILIRRMKDIYNEIFLFNKELEKYGCPLERIKKDKKEFEDKLLSLLKKGLLSIKISDEEKDLFTVLKSL